MSSFIVTYQTDQDGEVQTTAFTTTAREALDMAESSGLGARIAAPDRETYGVADFRKALDAGKFDEAQISGAVHKVDGGPHANPD